MSISLVNNLPLKKLTLISIMSNKSLLLKVTGNELLHLPEKSDAHFSDSQRGSKWPLFDFTLRDLAPSCLHSMVLRSDRSVP